MTIWGVWPNTGVLGVEGLRLAFEDGARYALGSPRLDCGPAHDGPPSSVDVAKHERLWLRGRPRRRRPFPDDLDVGQTVAFGATKAHLMCFVSRLLQHGVERMAVALARSSRRFRRMSFGLRDLEIQSSLQGCSSIPMRRVELETGGLRVSPTCSRTGRDLRSRLCCPRPRPGTCGRRQGPSHR